MFRLNLGVSAPAVGSLSATGARTIDRLAEPLSTLRCVAGASPRTDGITWGIRHLLLETRCPDPVALAMALVQPALHAPPELPLWRRAAGPPDSSTPATQGQNGACSSNPSAGSTTGVEELWVRLDGIPLVIELAAARIDELRTATIGAKKFRMLKLTVS
jgi:hypothetical protein